MVRNEVAMSQEMVNFVVPKRVEMELAVSRSGSEGSANVMLCGGKCRVFGPGQRLEQQKVGDDGECQAIYDICLRPILSNSQPNSTKNLVLNSSEIAIMMLTAWASTLSTFCRKNSA